MSQPQGPSYELKTIGVVRSCYKEKFGTPRQPGLVLEGRAVLQIEPSYAHAALEGLEKFSHIWVLFWFHENKNYQWQAKVQPPRLEGKKIGVFATRSPHRPNPIGLSVVRLDAIAENELHVSGIDFIEGTPLIDIKPYIAEYDSVPEASPGWLPQVQTKENKVSFSEEAEKGLQNLVREEQQGEFKNQILSLIAADPRPLVYRRSEYQGQVYGIAIDDLNVRFQWQGDHFVVTAIHYRE